MSFFRSLLRSKDSSQHLLRGLCFCRRYQFCNYSGAPKGNKNGMVYQRPSPEKTEGFQSRSPFSYAIPAGLLLIAGAGIFVRYNDERRAILKGQGTEKKNVTLKGPTSVGPFTLLDSDGRLTTEHNLLGNWVLLYFGYTSSPDIGPEEVQKMARATEMLESKQTGKLKPVFVTIDPERDSPSQLRAYLNEFDPKIVGLTGQISIIRQMAREFRVFFKKVEEEGDDYLVETPHNMYLLDPKMEIVSCFGIEYNAEQLSEEIFRVISGNPQ